MAGAEHYFGVLQSLYCAAAPVRDHLGRVVGVLDVSIDGRPFAFDALALVRLCTAGIENRLLSQQAQHEGAQMVLCFQASPALLSTPLEGRAVIADDGRVLGLNAAASRLLQLQAEGGATDAESLLGLPAATLNRLRRSALPQSHHLPSGLRVWLQAERAASAPKPGPAVLEPPTSGTAASLRATGNQLITDTLRDCQGNIAAAARRLGVSRGLLYRRLQSRAGTD